MFTSSIQAQFAFSIKPGIGLNGATFGFNLNSLVLSANIDYLNVGGSVEEAGKRFDYSL
jgi:hypothetical protein